MRRAWVAGPPPGRGRWWVVWSGQVQPIELSPAVIHYGDPNASLLIKTLTGVAYRYEPNRDDITHHMRMDPPTAPKSKKVRTPAVQ